MPKGCVLTDAPGRSCESRLFDVIHVTGDGKRMYVCNSLFSTLDHSGRFYVRLVRVGADGMKADPFFNIDLDHFKTGPARGHDMLAN